MERRSIEIDSEKLANIKSLQIDHNLTVEYIVSDEMRAEQYRYDYPDHKAYPKFEFSGDRLIIKANRADYGTNRSYFSSKHENIVIYGPKLEMIEEFAASSSREGKNTYEPVQASYILSQDQAKLTVKLNEDSNFEIVGRQKIESLNLELGDLASFSAPNISVEELKITGLRSTGVRVWSAGQIALNGQFRCVDNFDNRNGFELEYNNSPEITLNGEKVKAGQLVCSESDQDEMGRGQQF